MSIHILDVGQCGIDGPRMERLWREELGAKVTRVDDAGAASQKLRQGHYDVVLVNRVLNRDGSSGLEVIKTLKSEGVKTPIMLVSDLEEAQEEAVALGAVPGFGKASLDDPQTLELVKTTAGAKG